MYDELENALNDVIDDNGIVEWSLADSTLGELIPIDNDKRRFNIAHQNMR